MKISIIFIEILAICGIGFLFFFNRYDKQILTVALNVICIGLAFTLLSFMLSPSEIKFSLNRILPISTALLSIMILAFILAFYVNLEHKKESENFYIYFIYDKNKHTLADIKKDNNTNFLRTSSYFNNFVSPDENQGNFMEVDVEFFKDFLDFLIMRNMGFRYMGSWFIRFDKMPLSGISSWGPRDYKMPIKTEEIRQGDIIGYDQNRLINRVKVSQMDEIIKVPENTSISLEKGVETDLLPKRDLDKETKNRTRRITIKNNYCTISLDICFNGALTGDFFKDIKDETVTPGLDKCKLEVYAFKAKYKIEYKRFKMGTKELINYYKPWAEDLCTTFQETFDIQQQIKDVTKEEYLRIRGVKL